MTITVDKIGLAPDVAILIYLTKSNLLTAALQAELINYIQQGYQGELSYKHSDNSFSAFGNSDASGSSWLTAFVVRIFIQASAYITIDNAVITNGLSWLIAQQVNYEICPISKAVASLIFFFTLASKWKFQRTR